MRKNNLKKLSIIFLAAVMVLSSVLTVFGAPNPLGTETNETQAAATDDATASEEAVTSAVTAVEEGTEETKTAQETALTQAELIQKSLASSATGTVTEEEDELYLIDEAGNKLKNVWHAELMANPGYGVRHFDSEDPEIYRWYYFDKDGKAYRDAKRTINGKTYYFDDEGLMAFGWTDEDYHMLTGEYEEGDCPAFHGAYYFGPSYDGALKKGWHKESAFDIFSVVDESSPLVEKGYADVLWFYLGSGGRKVANEDEDRVYRTLSKDGKTYAIDENGVMLSGWRFEYKEDEGAFYTADDDKKAEFLDLVSYFGTSKDGAKVGKGWIIDVPMVGDKQRKTSGNYTYSDTGSGTYYIKGSHPLYNTVKKIDNKYIGFGEDGSTMGGLYVFKDNSITHVAQKDHVKWETIGDVDLPNPHWREEQIEEEQDNYKNMSEAYQIMRYPYCDLLEGYYTYTFDYENGVQFGNQTAYDDGPDEEPIDYELEMQTVILNFDKHGAGVNGIVNNKLYSNGLLLRAKYNKYGVAKNTKELEDAQWLYVVDTKGTPVKKGRVVQLVANDTYPEVQDEGYLAVDLDGNPGYFPVTEKKEATEFAHRHNELPELNRMPMILLVN